VKLKRRLEGTSVRMKSIESRRKRESEEDEEEKEETVCARE
jgi:hypothetical protein